MTPQDKFRYLLQMAAADDSISREELRLLGNRAITWGLTDDQFQALVEEAVRGETQLPIPDSQEERVALLADLIRMMGADGKLDELEKRLFATVAAQTDVDFEQLNEIIDTAIIDRDDP